MKDIEDPSTLYTQYNNNKWRYVLRQLQILRADIESHESVDSAMSRLQELRIIDEIPDTLILVQHPEVVTLGPKAERDGALKTQHSLTTQLES